MLFSLLAATLLVFAAGCAERSSLDVDAARRATRTAIRLVRSHAPSQAKYIERLVADAEIAAAAETHAPWWDPQTGRGAAAWLRAARAAHEATVAVRARQTGERERYLALLEAARDDVARARMEIREAGMERREAAALETAVTCVLTAQRLATAGEPGRAADKLEGARRMAAVVHQSWSTLHARFSDPQLRRQWRTWADLTIEESRDRGTAAIIVDKLQRRLILYYKGLRLASFPAELGANGLRRKEHAGDRATPEGMYRVVRLKDGHETKFYRALLINYPNDEDWARFSKGKQRGTIPYRAGIGSLIEIHGGGGEGRDWTDGCVALTDADMDRLFPHVWVGTPVTIVGTYER